MRILLVALLYGNLLSCKNTTPPGSSDSTVSIKVDTLSSSGVAGIDQQMALPTLPAGWIDLALADSTLKLDIRYATDNNFVSEAMYKCGRCLLRSEAAAKILQLQRALKSSGLGLKLFDCYRPASVQRLLWDKVPDARYVTPPAKGSMHNRGVAVDVTLIDLDSGDELDMGTGYDFFGKEAYHDYTGHDSTIHQNRTLLKEQMKSIDFRHIRTEWWHYSYTQGSFEISDYEWDCPDP